MGLIEKLKDVGRLRILQTSVQTVIGILDGVKFSLLGYKYPILKAGLPLRGVTIASVEDIACMKLHALAQRGAKA